MLEQVLIPVPIVPSRHTVSLKGAHAKFGIKSGQIRFYMAPPTVASPTWTCAAKVPNDKSDLENLDQLFHEEAGPAELPCRPSAGKSRREFTARAGPGPGTRRVCYRGGREGRRNQSFFWDFQWTQHPVHPRSNQNKRPVTPLSPCEAEIPAAPSDKRRSRLPRWVPRSGVSCTNLDPSLPVVKLQSMDDVFGQSVSRPMFLTTLLGAFAALALTLAAGGEDVRHTFPVSGQRATRRKSASG